MRACTRPHGTPTSTPVLNDAAQARTRSFDAVGRRRVYDSIRISVGGLRPASAISRTCRSAASGLLATDGQRPSVIPPNTAPMRCGSTRTGRLREAGPSRCANTSVELVESCGYMGGSVRVEMRDTRAVGLAFIDAGAMRRRLLCDGLLPLLGGDGSSRSRQPDPRSRRRTCTSRRGAPARTRGAAACVRRALLPPDSASQGTGEPLSLRRFQPALLTRASIELLPE